MYDYHITGVDVCMCDDGVAVIDSGGVHYVRVLP